MSIDRLAVNTIKGLAMDAVQKANSGHPGMPMGAADMAWVLWSRFLNFDPSDAAWPDRDRFVLSAGHGSMLLYSLLHLYGFGLELDELKNFRQLNSRTPGHPEFGHTPGVETTTGPLGQGFATGVGMAIAERWLREKLGSDVVNHRVFGIVGDGDLMEGISAEAASLAGHLKLGSIVYLYDDNHITIDGNTDLSFTEDRGARFAALGWHVQKVDGHDHEAIAAAISAAIADPRPSLICCRTHIGHGSPNKQDSEKSHGSPLGVEEIRLTKQGLGMDPDQHFHVPAEVLAAARAGNAERKARREAWEARAGDKWKAWLNAGDAPKWPVYNLDPKGIATRKASEAALNAAAAALPQILGGSADLAGSNGSWLKGEKAVGPDNFSGRNMCFGVREHAMAAACNGMALHGGIIPYCATFLVFHDYMRPSVRLSALMKQQVVYVYTHDSIYLGEDGPTHQPVEHLMSMRLIPNLVTIRPGDGNETVAAWQAALARKDGPTALSLTRQDLPTVTTPEQAANVHRGAYVLLDGYHVTLLASGSELSLALQARAELDKAGVSARVVSFPCWELFEAQDADYQRNVLGDLPRLAVEAGRTLGWQRWAHAAVGVDTFGASAPPERLAVEYGLTAENVAAAALRLLGR